jgi:hypothetical protein
MPTEISLLLTQYETAFYTKASDLSSLVNGYFSDFLRVMYVATSDWSHLFQPFELPGLAETESP